MSDVEFENEHENENEDVVIVDIDELMMVIGSQQQRQQQHDMMEIEEEEDDENIQIMEEVIDDQQQQGTENDERDDGNRGQGGNSPPPQEGVEGEGANEENEVVIFDSRKRKKLMRKTITRENTAFTFAKIAASLEETLTESKFTCMTPSNEAFSSKLSFPNHTDEERITKMAKGYFESMNGCECSIGNCREKFKYLFELLWHLAVDHLVRVVERQEDGPNVISYPCPSPGCTFSSASMYYLYDHWCSEIKFRRWKCRFCPAGFYSIKYLKGHIKGVHEPETVTVLEREVDNDGEYTGNLGKPLKRPKYTPKKLEVTFSNIEQKLVNYQESKITKYIEECPKRFILYTQEASQHFRRRCAVHLCTRAANGEFCPPCTPADGAQQPPFTTVAPDPIMDLAAHPPFYNVLQITNSQGQWINICSNKNCNMRFGLEGGCNNQNCCSEICMEYVKLLLRAPAEEGDEEEDPLPPIPSLEFQWPWDVNFDPPSNLLLTHYNNSPPENSVRIYPITFEDNYWKLMCCAEACTNPQHTNRLCGPCITKLKRSQNLQLKTKPDGHNLQVNIVHNPTNDIKLSTFTEGDTIWMQEVMINGKWERECAKWGCGVKCKSNSYPLFCRMHAIAASEFFPQYKTTTAAKRSSNRAAKKAADTPSSSSSSKKKSKSTVTEVVDTNQPSTSTATPSTSSSTTSTRR